MHRVHLHESFSYRLSYRYSIYILYNSVCVCVCVSKLFGLAKKELLKVAKKEGFLCNVIIL